MRTDDEIFQRAKAVQTTDLFGTQAGDLYIRLPFQYAKDNDVVRDDIAEADWKVAPRDRERVLDEMREYMPFAVGKASDHRGLSANRSIAHFMAWVWLLGDEDYAAIDWGNYTNYGAPILKQIAGKYGFSWPDNNTVIAAMAEGTTCPECTDGIQEGVPDGTDPENS